MGVRGRSGSGASASVDAAPSVVLLHGVGVAPMLFDGLIAELAAAGTTAIAPPRAGYRGDGTPHDVADAARDVVALTRSIGRVVLVGVDGGATLALVAALTGDRSIAAAVVHEPIVGPFSPSLHRIVLDHVGALGRSSTPAVTAEVMADWSVRRRGPHFRPMQPPSSPITTRPSAPTWPCCRGSS